MQFRLVAGLAGLLASVLFAPTANAITIGGAAAPPCPSEFISSFRSSIVTSAAAEVDPGVFRYDFRVCNTSSVGEDGSVPVIRDWELPWFADAGISLASITSPAGWAFSIETVGVANPDTGWGTVARGSDVPDGTGAIPQWQVDGDPWKAIFDAAYGGAANNPFNTNTEVLHWYYTEDDVETACAFIRPGESCGGFGFDAIFGPTGAPYQASWLALPPRTGDPDFPFGNDTGGLPNSPSVQINRVPEPGSALLLALGLMTLGACAGRRSRRV